MTDGELDEVARLRAEKKAKHAAYMREWNKRKRQENPEGVREAERQKAARAKAKNPERQAALQAARSKRYFAKKLATETPEQRTKRLADLARRNRKRFEKNPEHVRKLSRINAKRLYDRDPSKAISYVRRRQHKLAEGEVTQEEWLTICDWFGHRCGYCRRTGLKLTQDHVVALSRGGQHWWDNIVPACQQCNSTKGNRDHPRPEPWSDENPPEPYFVHTGPPTPSMLLGSPDEATP